MYAIQLDLFKTPEQCEIDALRLQNAEMRQTLDRVRKGTYARLNVHESGLSNHEERLAIVERLICRG